MNRVIATAFIARTACAAAVMLLLAGCAEGAPTGEALPGRDFAAEARIIQRYIACAESAAPAGMAQSAYDSHCLALRRKADHYRRVFIDKIRPFAEREFPRNIPATIIYPFGGSDLFAALAAFPGAESIITISLESAGDPRPLAKGDPALLAKAMGDFLSTCGRFLETQDNSYANLRELEKSSIPGQITFSIMAAMIYGYEPLSLRFFRIDKGGALHYYSGEEIGSLERVPAPRLHPRQVQAKCSAAFMNMEIGYRHAGEGERGRRFVHRHIAANLSNPGFASSPLREYLEGLGRISAMTRGASYLLWWDSFSALRNYLLRNMDFMISDATGILPRHARAEGFGMTPYGTFHGALLEGNVGDLDKDFMNLWSSQPRRPLDFRFGYADIRGSNHLIIYRPGHRP